MHKWCLVFFLSDKEGTVGYWMGKLQETLAIFMQACISKRNNFYINWTLEIFWKEKFCNKLTTKKKDYCWQNKKAINIHNVKYFTFI